MDHSINPRFSVALSNSRGMIEAGYYHESGESVFKNGFRILGFDRYDFKFLIRVINKTGKLRGKLERTGKFDLYLGPGVDIGSFKTVNEGVVNEIQLLNWFVAIKIQYNVIKNLAIFANVNLLSSASSGTTMFQVNDVGVPMFFHTEGVNLGIGLALRL